MTGTRDAAGTDDPDEPPAGMRIRLLHVEDDPEFADLTREFLSRVAPLIDYETVTSISAARDHHGWGDHDAIVCDYDLPDGTGIDLLKTIRMDQPELPVILFTGKGSEEVASEAISAGVTDYLQKGTGREQYEVLANRVRNAVDRHRVTRQLERSVAALDSASEGIGIIGDDGEYLYVNPAYADIYDAAPGDLVGNHWTVLYPDEEVNRFENEILPALTASGHWSGTARAQCVNGTTILEKLSLTHTADGGHVCIIRDTERRPDPGNPDDPGDPVE
ncbi:response regulator [Halorubrum gandharaense]